MVRSGASRLPPNESLRWRPWPALTTRARSSLLLLLVPHDRGKGHGPCPSLIALAILALVFAPLLGHLVKDDAGRRAEIKALDHAEHRYREAGIAAPHCPIAYPALFVAGPTGPLCMFGYVGRTAVWVIRVE